MSNIIAFPSRSPVIDAELADRIAEVDAAKQLRFIDSLLELDEFVVRARFVTDRLGWLDDLIGRLCLERAHMAASDHERPRTDT